MKLLLTIKRDKTQLETTRTVVKIHISWSVYRTMVKEGPMADYDEKTNNLMDMLLCCQLVKHVDQVESYWFEDVNGQRNSGSIPWL